jgi:hypothetical protein
MEHSKLAGRSILIVQKQWHIASGLARAFLQTILILPPLSWTVTALNYAVC